MAGCDHLFVYGTLMSAASDPMGIEARSRLVHEATQASAATTPGLLYDLGRYPGMVLPSGETALVHGEVMRLHEPERTLAWLDAYEGIDPRPSARNEYIRTIAWATLTDGSEREAWVYRYILEIEGFYRISSGRWLDRRAGLGL